MGECLDVEAQSWAYAHDVFTIELLQDCRLACIVKATIKFFVNNRERRN